MCWESYKKRMSHTSPPLSGSVGPDLCVELKRPAPMKDITQSDADITSPDQRRTVCRLIFRGDPCIILGSDILSVSTSAPRYPSGMKNLDAVPCNSALNPWYWDLSIIPQMEWMPLHRAKKRQYYLSSRRCLMPSKLKNKNGHVFCRISLIWNRHRSGSEMGAFEVVRWTFFFFNKSSEVHLHGCLCSFTGDFQSLFGVITFSSALKNRLFTAALFVTTANRPAFPKCH